jgi:hypothetical protein
MGPPKRVVKPPTYGEILNRFDFFEQYYLENADQYYLVNPYTGETVYTSEERPYGDRNTSLWVKFDGKPSQSVVSYQLFGQTYLSRQWGRRDFRGWESKDAAATHIAAVTRGMQARMALRAYYKTRYEKVYDPYSQYYFFVDRWQDADDITEPSWHKPCLAFPTDIEEVILIDPEDHMRGDKYTYRGFERGPYLTRAGMNKRDIDRAKTNTFKKPNAWRDQAITTPAQIDLDTAKLGDILAWMDDLKAVEYHITDYSRMRTACVNNNWERVYDVMMDNLDRPLTHVYALFAFAKMEVSCDQNGLLEMGPCRAYNYCIEYVNDPLGERPDVLKCFALYALNSLLSLRSGRAEYFDQKQVKVQGKKRAAAVQEFFSSRLRIFVSLCDAMEMESYTFRLKPEIPGGLGEEVTVHGPTSRGAAIAQFSLTILGYLAEEQEHREMIAETVTNNVLFCMKRAPEDSSIQIAGLKTLYNFCYRCESGQITIREAQWRPVIKQIHENFSGEPEVLKICRRLELALVDGGYRGAVEGDIAREMADPNEPDLATRSRMLLERMAIEDEAKKDALDDKLAEAKSERK